jgi:hypothetical protein
MVGHAVAVLVVTGTTKEIGESKTKWAIAGTRDGPSRSVSKLSVNCDALKR